MLGVDSLFQSKTDIQKMRAYDPIRFLVATDVHLGHSENNQQLGNDSYEAFEQVLNIAQKQNVDFLLLGGDLFDQVNPTQKCLYKCLKLLQKKVFGNKQNFSLNVKGTVPNFSNENLNIGLPIFTIHGNHDYPSNDFGKLSVCDLLHASNLVNYFGKKDLYTNKGSKKMTVTPLIFQKPSEKIKLALYGIGYIKDLRLHKELSDNQVIFEQPQDKANTICILIVHQNRWKGKKGGVGAGYENCILPRYFPQWMDLIIWGHQHEAIQKVQVEENRKIFQPGSTVITSYIEAESIMKQCLLITIGGNQKMQIESIKLKQSHRPMLIRAYSLDQILKSHEVPQKQEFNFQSYFSQEIEQMLSECNQKKMRKKPIIRIKIDYTGYQIVRMIKLEQKFNKEVANSYKIFKYSHKVVKKKDKISELSDKEVIDFVRNYKLLDNHREKDITTEILQLFEEQFNKTSKFCFLDMDFVKDKINQLTNNSEGKVYLTGVVNSYKNQLSKRSSQHTRKIDQWNQSQNKQYKMIKNALLEQKAKTLRGEQFEQIHYKGLINSHRQKYKQKQLEILPIFTVKSAQNALTFQKQSQNIKGKKGTKKQSKGNLNRDSGFSESDNYQLEIQSEEEDCCARAAKSQYQEKNTIQNYRMAEQMAFKDDKKKKNKKKVDFK